MKLGDLQVSLEGPVVVARLSGEVDLSNTEEIEQGIVTATPNHAEVVLLDLGEVDYMDSAGIHLIYRLREKLQSRGQSLRLVVGDSSPAADALRLAGVMDHLDVRGTIETALDYPPAS